jgi:hypothetical protein
MIIIIIIIITITIVVIIIIKIKIIKNFVLGGYCMRCTDFAKTYNPPQTKFLITPLVAMRGVRASRPDER